MIVSDLSTPKLKRMAAFDLARGLAIFFMILIHVLDFYSQANIQESVFGTIIEALGSWPAAPIFVFIMGVFLTYSNTINLSQGFRRAALLFTLGYLLNLARGTLPMWFSLELGLVTDQQLGGYTPLTEFLVADILQFAGLSYAFCLVVMHFFHHPKVWLIIALIIIFFSPFVWDITSNIVIVDEILKLFWGHYKQGAMFPFFPWVVYPLVGMAFGFWLKNSHNLIVFFRKTLFTGGLLIILGSLITLSNVEFHVAALMRSGPGATIACLGFIFIWLYCCWILVEYLPDNPVFKLLYFWSQHVTSLYVIQWLLLGWGLVIFGSQQLALSSTLITMLSILILTDIGTRAWVHVRHKKNLIESSIN